jgi:hypothetical protein
MNSSFRCIFIGVFMITVLSSSISFAKTFRGKVIDADTKEPIEGAVVVAEWSEETTTPTATHFRLKDVKEVLTDKNGEWMIKGPRGGEIGNIKTIISVLTGAYFTKRPRFYILKPGYCSCPAVPGIKVCNERMRPQGINGEGEILELPKLTKKEDRLYTQGMTIPDCFFEMTADIQKARKIKNFLRLLNQEARFLGLDEYPMGKELENEK